MFEITPEHIDRLIKMWNYQWEELEKLLKMKEKLTKKELESDPELSMLLWKFLEYIQNKWSLKNEENEQNKWSWKIYNLKNIEELDSFKKLSLWSKFRSKIWTKTRDQEFKKPKKRTKQFLWSNLYD